MSAPLWLSSVTSRNVATALGYEVTRWLRISAGTVMVPAVDRGDIGGFTDTPSGSQ